jgi:hypothetical protein
VLTWNCISSLVFSEIVIVYYSRATRGVSRAWIGHAVGSRRRTWRASRRTQASFAGSSPSDLDPETFYPKISRCFLQSQCWDNTLKQAAPLPFKSLLCLTPHVPVLVVHIIMSWNPGPESVYRDRCFVVFLIFSTSSFRTFSSVNQSALHNLSTSKSPEPTILRDVTPYILGNIPC